MILWYDMQALLTELVGLAGRKGHLEQEVQTLIAKAKDIKHTNDNKCTITVILSE